MLLSASTDLVIIVTAILLNGEDAGLGDGLAVDGVRQRDIPTHAMYEELVRVPHMGPHKQIAAP